ncbi:MULTISPECIES: MBL fold metallo-hydrolase [Exiguobacterium]|uniref:MBL fold metallo-hydrolase n=1 Tax=Exiguobacterium TaxID=33986 RepID=UPI001BED38A2|nr:MBL fold metallo-hydrolase [Exiguobacterium himgiriensis]MCT4783701.1 MBL fold metallo-hydrolase [Exiguobacterium himgiriensis]
MIQVRLQSFTVYESALMRTTSTLIHTEESLILVDPTWLPEEVAMIRRDIELTRNGKKLYVIYTHHHYDHLIGAYAFPDATVIASRAFVETNSDEQLHEIQSFYEQNYIDRPIQKPNVDLIIAEDGTLELGATPITFYLTPGHDSTHLSLVVEPLKLLICGDYGSNIEPPFIEHDAEAYIHSLQTLQTAVYEHEIRWLVPGHGDVCDDRSKMIERLSAAEEYILALPEERVWSPLWPTHAFFDRVHERNRKHVEQKMQEREARRQDY